jgi:predicted AAA+ superfamily ATPase
MAIELWDAVEQREDVLAGTLTDAVFAANLDDVVAGSAPDVYKTPEVFFANTFPSAGLRGLLEEALGRVGGSKPDSEPVIRLETNLGGGKTHNLIALYHAARGELDPLRAAEFMDPSLLPAAPVEQVGVFVGTSSGATSFPTLHGISPRTPWGFLALQLGGGAAFERVREDDERLSAPGADQWHEIIGGRPTVLLVDEIARYVTVAEAVPVADSTLAKQVTAFLMSLMEAVASEPRAVLVLTTTEVTEAFGDQTEQVLAAIAEAYQLVARKEFVLRPSDEADLPRILARRLFASVDPNASQPVATDYASASSEAFGRGADLPERLTSGTWAGEVAETYPFHPDLLTVLDKRLSTIPNFHRTRGALRLLARTVRVLWQATVAHCQKYVPARFRHCNAGQRDCCDIQR